MTKYNNIYDYILAQETSYQSTPIDINGWSWSMKEHIKTSFYYKYGRLLNGNDEDTPVKNITRPILNLAYRAEDIDVKDIVLYVDDPDYYYQSFLIKKYHDDVFIVENDLETFFDEVKESKIDYGLGVAKRMSGARPETIDLQSIAFCDQTNVMGGPIGLKHFYEADQLKEMEKSGWGDTKNGATITIDDLITLSEDKKVMDDQSGIENTVTGNQIEIYEVHGVLPKQFLDDSETGENVFVRQMHIVGFYKDSSDKKQGVTLFKKKSDNPFKSIMRDSIYGRACGFGGAEEIFEDQVWTNYGLIRKKELIDSAAKTILKGIGTDLKSKYPNGLKDMDTLEIVELNAGEDLAQIDTTPRSVALFDNFMAEMEAHAQRIGSASDSLLGESPTSGTPFRLNERVVMEGKGLHEYRREKFAKFIELMYRDWFIPEIVKKITEGGRFLAELNQDELEYVTEAIVKNKVRDYTYEQTFDGVLVSDEEKKFYEDKVREEFAKKGNKHFIEVLKGEFNKKPIRVKINVAGKQKDLALMTDKMVNIFRQIMSNPQGFLEMMKIPSLSKSFNAILEYSNISPVNFASIKSPIQPQQQLQQAQQQAKPQAEALAVN